MIKAIQEYQRINFFYNIFRLLVFVQITNYFKGLTTNERFGRRALENDESMMSNMHGIKTISKST